MTVSGGDIASYNGTVNLNLAGGQDITDTAGNVLPTNEPVTDETYTLDNIAPAIVISQAGTQVDPTNTSPVVFAAVSSEPINTGTFTGADINISGTATSGTVTVAEIAPNAGTTFSVSVVVTADGTVIATIPAGGVEDTAGNTNTVSTSIDNSITFDSAPTVTINQAASQADPTNTSPIVFNVVFSEDVTDFDDYVDVTISGMAAVPGIIITSTGSGDTYTVSVSGMVDGETITATIAANVAIDTVSNGNEASTSTDNQVTFDTYAISIITGGITITPDNEVLQNYGVYGTHFTNLEITFNADANNPAGNNSANDVTNPNNYLLIQSGNNTVYNTTSCLNFSNNGGTPLSDDVLIPTGGVDYDAATFTASLTLNNGTPLPAGEYRLFVCGSTSITDLAGNHLNNGIDSVTTFTIRNLSLPATGFPMGRVTTLPTQSKNKSYSEIEMTLSIPTLDVEMPIVGVPQTETGWDVSWLGQNAGYLAGSAFPTWEGNTVITAHVWDSFNQPGPFSDLKMLKYGDQVQIHAWGLTYTYEVRESKLVTTRNVNTVLQSEEYDWITLMTCEFYNPFTGEYLFRRSVHAVLVSVQ